jgi:mediator of RNA polymerase II transcription subunit 14
LVEQIRAQLRKLESLNSHVSYLRRLECDCTVVSLSRLAFIYSKAPVLSAELKFARNETSSTKLHLEPASSNPHNRVRIMLEQALNNGRESTFAEVAVTLKLTLPALQFFDRLEDAHMTKRTATISARSPTLFVLSYRSPLPACAFTIRTRSKKQNEKTLVRWHVEPLKRARTESSTSDDLQSALKALFSERPKGERWFGIGNGLIADHAAVVKALERLEPNGVVASAQNVPPQDQAIAQQQADKQAPAPTQPMKAPAKQKPDVIMLDDD